MNIPPAPSPFHLFFIFFLFLFRQATFLHDQREGKEKKEGQHSGGGRWSDVGASRFFFFIGFYRVVEMQPL